MSEPQKVRLIDIARELNISHASVASVLTGGSSGTRVSLKTAEKIRAAARKMNYQPNLHARVLRGGSSKVVGIVIFGLASEIFNHIVESFNKSLRCWEYQTLIAMPSGEDSLEEVLNYMQAFAVDALAVLSYPIAVDPERFRKALSVWKRPLVLIDPCLDGFPAVSIDRAAGMEKLLNFLIQSGKRDFVYLRSLPNFSMDKLRGVEETVRKHGLDWSDEHIWNLSDNHNGYVGAVERLLERKKLPDCVICAGDVTAFGVISELLKRGIRVPEDIGVTGFDDSPLLQFCPVPVTTLRHPVFEVGASAANLLLQSIQKPDGEVKNLHIPPELIIRNSV
jgi:LacI family transcriptional regulator